MVAQWTALPTHTKKVVGSIKHVLASYANAPPRPNSLFFFFFSDDVAAAPSDSAAAAPL